MDSMHGDTATATHENAGRADEEDASEEAPVAVPSLVRVLHPSLRLHRLHAVQEPDNDQDEEEEGHELQGQSSQEDLFRPTLY